MVYTDNELRFEWDESKSRSNQAKHGIHFEQALYAFYDPDAFIEIDRSHSTAYELREMLIGAVELGVIVVIFTIRQNGSVYRLISARNANRKERILYEKEKRDF